VLTASSPHSNSQIHVKEFERAYHKAKMAMSFASSAAVPGANAQQRNGDEIQEIVVEVCTSHHTTPAAG
jgi:hypothetical protein